VQSGKESHSRQVEWQESQISDEGKYETGQVSKQVEFSKYYEDGHVIQTEKSEQVKQLVEQSKQLLAMEYLEIEDSQVAKQ
jgi:hypothetical protein